MGRRNRKLYVVVIILGGLALVVDRIILPSGPTGPTGPEVAIASSEPEMPDSLSQADPHPIENSLIPEVPFPRGITPVSDTGELRDLFAPPQELLPADNQPDRPKAHPPPDKSSSDRFMSQHHLKAVMVNLQVRIAVVDDTLLHLGESIDGCTLMGIEGQAVRFQCFDGDAVLEVTGRRTERSD